MIEHLWYTLPHRNNIFDSLFEMEVAFTCAMLRVKNRRFLHEWTHRDGYWFLDVLVEQ